MIIQCESCSKKFNVSDADIPQNGRKVQCGNCSYQWLQLPVQNEILLQPTVFEEDGPKKLANDSNDFKKEITFNGKKYKFLGVQWAELLPSGKSGALAKKNLSNKLDSLSGRINNNKIKNVKTRKTINNINKKNNLGFFGYIFLIIIISFSVMGIFKTFENEILEKLPNAIYIYETFDNFVLMAKDLFKQY